MNFVSYLFETSRHSREAFLLSENETLTYPDLYCRVGDLAAWLHGRYGRGNRILVVADNSAFFITGYLATIASGNCAVCCGTDLTRDGLERIVRDCMPVAAFAEEKYRPLLAGTGPECPGGEMPGMAADGGCDRDAAVPADDGDPAVIIYTSGSTGEKKGVVLTHRNLAANTDSIVTSLNLTAADRVCVVLPFTYCYGASLLHTHIRAGGSVVLSRPPVSLNASRDIDRYGCTGFAGVPSTFQILLGWTPFADQRFPTLRYMTQAGGRLPDKYLKILAERFADKEIFVMYGATEATARMSILPPALLKEKMGSIGKGMPGVTLAVVRDDGTPVLPGETGEIVARGGNIMKEYLNDPEGTREVLRDGWLHTGDLATVDDDGFIFIRGRTKHLIKSAGFRVSAAEIEREILAVPGIAACTVVGLPDDTLGEAVAAMVQPCHGLDHRDLRARILDHCRRRLPAYKNPVHLLIVDEIPLNASGKADTERAKGMFLSCCRDAAGP
jgi:acyl-CoA synthetase (AMP-forming)/AMP-acid ligase II